MRRRSFIQWHRSCWLGVTFDDLLLGDGVHSDALTRGYDVRESGLKALSLGVPCIPRFHIEYYLSSKQMQFYKFERLLGKSKWRYISHAKITPHKRVPRRAVACQLTMMPSTCVFARLGMALAVSSHSLTAAKIDTGIKRCAEQESKQARAINYPTEKAVKVGTPNEKQMTERKIILDLFLRSSTCIL